MHNLNMGEDGEAAMMYRGETPWHALGTAVKGVLYAAEAIQKTRADWRVNLEPVYRLTSAGVKEVENRRVIVREDTGAEFGIVTKAYSPIQNSDAFNFFDPIVKEGLAQYETAGVLGAGERVWVQCSMPGGFTLPGTKDRTNPFAFLTTTHDGSGACQIIFGSVRVVCQNTIRLAMRNGKTAWSIRHVGNVEAAIKDARHAMGEAQGLFAAYQRRAHALAQAACSRDALAQYLLTLIPDNAAAKTTNARTANIRAEIIHLAQHGKGNDGRTFWSAYNGVTEYVDHERSARGTESEKAANRFESSFFGSGASLKQDALDLALDMAGVK